MSVIPIAFDKIERNPHRNLEENPLKREQIDLLVRSIGSTGFWEGMQVRPHPDKPGCYQLVSGHARVQAARDFGLTGGEFFVREMDDDAMLRAMADENLSQFGKDSAATYREAVTAAVEQLLAHPAKAQHLLRLDPQRRNEDRVLTEMANGGCPGERLVAAYFKGTLSLRSIRTALQEYRESGKLAAWHAAHNPDAIRVVEKPTLSREALAKFEATHHVQAFADSVRKLKVPIERQAELADTVLQNLKPPKSRIKTSTAPKTKTRAAEFARAEQPPNERLNAHNIKVQTSTIVRERARSPAQRQRALEMARHLDTQKAMTEISIGLKRAARGSTKLLMLADGGADLTLEMDQLRVRELFGEAQQHYSELENNFRIIMRQSGVTLRRIK